MTLFLVQHGQAKPETEDPERSLTDQGAEIVGRMADWAAQVGLTVDQIQHSGKRRAELNRHDPCETAEPAERGQRREGTQPER